MGWKMNILFGMARFWWLYYTLRKSHWYWNIDAIKTYSRNWNTAQYFGWPPRYSGESKINKHQTYHVRQKWTTSNKFSKIPAFWEPHHPAPITTQVIRLTCTTSKSLYWGDKGAHWHTVSLLSKKNKAIITEPNLPPNLPVVVPPAFMCLVSLDDTHGTTPSEVHLKSIGVRRKKRVFCFHGKNLREAWKRLHSPQQKNVKISRQFWTNSGVPICSKFEKKKEMTSSQVPQQTSNVAG